MNLASGAVPLSSYGAEWFTFWLSTSIRGAVILLAACLMYTSLKRVSAATRQLLWELALGGLLILPLLSIVLPTWDAPLLPEWLNVAPDAAAPAPSRGLQVADTSVEVVAEQTLPDKGGAGRRGAPPNWPRIVLMFWLFGALVFAARMLTGFVGVKLIKRSAKPLSGDSRVELARALGRQVGLPRPVPVLQSERVAVPMIGGLFRPFILLPGGAECWETDRLRHVLMHELVHVKRRDYAVQFLVCVVCTLYWFNPLTWFAARRLGEERERACDDGVLRMGARASDYAGHLLEVARSLTKPECSPLMTVAMTGRTRLQGRLEAVLNPAVVRRDSTCVFRALVVVLLASITLPLAALHPAPRAGEVLAGSPVAPGSPADEADDRRPVSPPRGGTEPDARRPAGPRRSQMQVAGVARNSALSQAGEPFTGPRKGVSSRQGREVGADDEQSNPGAQTGDRAVRERMRLKVEATGRAINERMSLKVERTGEAIRERMKLRVERARRRIGGTQGAEPTPSAEEQQPTRSGGA